LVVGAPSPRRFRTAALWAWSGLSLPIITWTGRSAPHRRGIGNPILAAASPSPTGALLMLPLPQYIGHKAKLGRLSQQLAVRCLGAHRAQDQTLALSRVDTGGRQGSKRSICNHSAPSNRTLSVSMSGRTTLLGPRRHCITG